MVESRLVEAGLLLLIVHLFELGRWYVANRSQEPLLVEPGHPVESGELDIVDSLPRAVLSNDLGLVQADHRFGQCVVIGVIARFVPEITLRKKNGGTWGSSDPVSRCPANPELSGSFAGRQSGFKQFWATEMVAG